MVSVVADILKSTLSSLDWIERLGGLLCLSILFILMLKDDIDSDFDGIRDKDQVAEFPAEIDLDQSSQGFQQPSR